MVPEGHRKLAGGANHRTVLRKWSPPRQGRQNRRLVQRSAAPAGAVASWTSIRWLTPPANFERPSGTGDGYTNSNVPSGTDDRLHNIQRPSGTGDGYTTFRRPLRDRRSATQHSNVPPGRTIGYTRFQRPLGQTTGFTKTQTASVRGGTMPLAKRFGSRTTPAGPPIRLP